MLERWLKNVKDNSKMVSQNKGLCEVQEITSEQLIKS